MQKTFPPKFSGPNKQTPVKSPAQPQPVQRMPRSTGLAPTRAAIQPAQQRMIKTGAPPVYRPQPTQTSILKAPAIQTMHRFPAPATSIQRNTTHAGNRPPAPPVYRPQVVQPSPAPKPFIPNMRAGIMRPALPGRPVSAVQMRRDWTTYITGVTKFEQKSSAKYDWKAKRKAYINAIRKKKASLDTELEWDSYITEVSEVSGQATAAIAVHDMTRMIYIAAQEGAGFKEDDIQIKEALKLGAEGYYIQEIGGAASGLHAEMQIVSWFLAQGQLPPKGMHFAAAGKPCCNCCAAMITALGGTCKSAGQSPYEYMWCDPFALHDNMMDHHPIIKVKAQINDYGWDEPIMRT